MAWLVLCCRGVASGAAGWARRDIPVFAGMSRRARGSCVASSWPLACLLQGSGGKECWSVSSPPPSSLDAVSFLGCETVSLAPFWQVTCAENATASQAFNVPGGAARRFRWRTYPLTLALEGDVLDDFLITFLWSSASPRIPHVWSPPWPGPSCVRLVGEEG